MREKLEIKKERHSLGTKPFGSPLIMIKPTIAKIRKEVKVKREQKRAKIGGRSKP